jgi:hypothetical protein
MKPYCAHCQTNDHWGNECPNPTNVKVAEPPKRPIFRHCPTCTCTVTKPVTKVTKSVTKVGRPRVYQSAADKQKDYRKRKKEREAKA